MLNIVIKGKWKTILLTYLFLNYCPGIVHNSQRCMELLYDLLLSSVHQSAVIRVLAGDTELVLDSWEKQKWARKKRCRSGAKTIFAAAL